MGRKLLGLAGFLMLGLSPSFVDWQQSPPQKRVQILFFYAVALGLFWVGVLA